MPFFLFLPRVVLCSVEGSGGLQTLLLILTRGRRYPLGRTLVKIDTSEERKNMAYGGGVVFSSHKIKLLLLSPSEKINESTVPALRGKLLTLVSCCCLHIINHPGLSIQHLLLSQSLCTNPTLDSADFRGHRLTYLEKVYENKMDPRGSAGR